jgi:hypothetical protein
MRRLAALTISAFLAFAPAAAFAQTAAPAQPVTATAGWDASAPLTATVVVPPTVQKAAGIINVGQAFGTILEPYIDAAVNALILAAMGWFAFFLRTRLNISIDQGQRDALTKFLQNRASSLIADGAVRMDGVTVKVNNERLADAVNAAAASIPDAVAHFGLTPDVLSAKIIDAIPQVPAGAQIVAQAHVDATPMTDAQKSAAAPTKEPTPTGPPA